MKCSLFIALSVWTTLSACERQGGTERKVLASEEAERRGADYDFVGVNAKDFVCDSVAPRKDVEAALGTTVEPADPHFTPPAGVPAPCNYLGPAPELLGWSFDLDCRKSAPEAGAQLMVTYASQPESTPVRVGKSGIDHRDSVLLFIDDDAPCYGRVLGPGADRRLALARLVSDGLQVHNAPREVLRATATQAEK